MFRDEDFILSSIRAQVKNLCDVLKYMEEDKSWKENLPYYTKRIQSVERALSKIRSIEVSSASGVF